MFNTTELKKRVAEKKALKAAARKPEELKGIREFFREEEGMGTVEIILIIVVLIGLVIIFKKQLTALVNTVFDKITRDSKTVMS